MFIKQLIFFIIKLFNPTFGLSDDDIEKYVLNKKFKKYLFETDPDLKVIFRNVKIVKYSDPFNNSSKAVLYYQNRLEKLERNVQRKYKKFKESIENKQEYNSDSYQYFKNLSPDELIDFFSRT